jgi:hypothetical protein
MAEASGLAVRDLPIPAPMLASVAYWRRENSEDPALVWLRGVFGEIATGL